MHRLFLGWVAVLVLAGFATASHAQSENSISEQRLAQLEAEVAELRQALYAPANAGACDVCCECPPSGFYGGAEVVFAKPFLKEAFRASVVDLTGTQSLLPYEYGYNATPRGWLGYVGPEQLGVRARYWNLQQDSGPETFVADGFSFPGTQSVTVIFPAAISTDAPGEVLSVSTGIELTTFELEGTFHFDGWGNQFVASAGLQYAKISQNYQSAVIVGGLPEQILNWDRSLEGLGPTAGLQLRRPVGNRGLQFFGGAQVALLYSEKDIHRFSIGGAAPPPFGGIPFVNLNDADELLATGQLQLGVEWTRELTWGGDLFVRGTYEGQIWTDSGGNALGYLGVEGFGLAIGVTK